MPNLTITPQQILAVEGIDASYKELMADVPLPSFVDKVFHHNASSSLPIEPYSITELGGGFEESPEGTDFSTDTPNVESVLLTNKLYKRGVKVPYSMIQYDRYGEIQRIVDNAVSSYRDFWMGQVMTVLNSGETATSYDGKVFFADDHVLAGIAGQANYVEVNISDLPTTEHGTGVTAPSPSELYQAAVKGISTLRTIKSATNTFPNEHKMQYHVLLPESFSVQAQSAFASENLASAVASTILTLSNSGPRFDSESSLNITYSTHASLNLTDAFIVSVVDTPEKPFIRQTKEFRIDSLLYDSDHFALNDQLLWIPKIWAASGLFHWYRAAMVRLRMV
jgi:hypothetical protein